MAVVVSLSWHLASDFSSAHCMPSGVGDSVPASPDTWLGRHSYQGACCVGGLCHSRLQIFSSFVFSQSGVSVFAYCKGLLRFCSAIKTMTQRENMATYY